MTAPFFMPVIAYLWLREHAPKFALLALPIGFSGVLLVLTPDDGFNWVAVIGVLGGLLAAIAKVTVRRLGHSEPTFRVVFYFTLFATVISSIPMLWAWQMPNAQSWYLLILMGLVGTIGQMLLTRGYAVARAAQIAPFTYFSVIYGAIFGYIFWQEVLDRYFVIGAILIAIAGLIAVRPPGKGKDNSIISETI